VNGTPVRFVVDTGASGVALSRTDAARAGIPITDADFTGEARTAGGTIRVAPVRLSRVEIGTIEVRDVPGVVLDVADAMPLLGQSFLGRIDKVSIEGDRMTLTKR
jgi:aspartyl protease family protein